MDWPAAVEAAPGPATFDDFSISTWDWEVTFQGHSTATDQDGPGGFSRWVEWCYRVRALQTTTDPGEWTHLSFGIADVAPHNQVEILIESSMMVSQSNSDYSVLFRTSDGPLQMRGAEWNSLANHLLTQGESANLCFATPFARTTAIQIGMKVSGDRRFAIIAGPERAFVAPALDYRGMLLLVVFMFGIACGS